jgi:hypothetical protein
MRIKLYKQWFALLWFLVFTLTSQSIQAATPAWFVVDGTTVTGTETIATTTKNTTPIFIAKGALVSGLEHWSHKPTTPLSIYIRPNTPLSGWEQVHSHQESTNNNKNQNHATKPQVKQQSATPKTNATTVAKDKTPCNKLPFFPEKSPLQATLLTAASTASFSMQKNFCKASAKTSFNSNPELHHFKRQVKTPHQTTARQPKWRSHHTNRPPPFL